MKSVSNNSNDSSNNKNHSKANLKRSISGNPKQKSKKSTSSVTNNNSSPPVNTATAPQTQTPVVPAKNPVKNEASTSSHGKEKVCKRFFEFKGRSTSNKHFPPASPRKNLRWNQFKICKMHLGTTRQNRHRSRTRSLFKIG